jgi:hypothetical protein
MLINIKKYFNEDSIFMVFSQILLLLSCVLSMLFLVYLINKYDLFINALVMYIFIVSYLYTNKKEIMNNKILTTFNYISMSFITMYLFLLMFQKAVYLIELIV